MGSVQGYVECVNCHREECSEDYNYKTGETNQICFDCGYVHSANYKRDEEGNFVMKDPAKGLLYENLILEEIKIDDPYGCYSIRFKDGGGQIGSLPTKKSFDEMKKAVAENANKDSELLDCIYVKRYIRGKEGKKGRFTTIWLLKNKEKS